MKISTRQLRQLIKEEIENVSNQMTASDVAKHVWNNWRKISGSSELSKYGDEAVPGVWSTDVDDYVESTGVDQEEFEDAWYEFRADIIAHERDDVSRL